MKFKNFERKICSVRKKKCGKDWLKQTWEFFTSIFSRDFCRLVIIVSNQQAVNI